ncbi:MAG: hypothetical protein JWN40_2899 [Phycisphaerales bacterium]|nr:hypothetical protein [Phycisphaerales bacterium]
MATPWSLEADFLQACNCEYGCPCEFEAPPSHGKCEGVGVWHIIKGRYGDANLDGLTFGFAATWPGALHLGGGTGGFVIDSAANPQQREAITKIASGEAGRMPFEVIRMTFSKLLAPAFAPATFPANGTSSSASLGAAIIVAVEPIKNPVNGQPEKLRVEHETGFMFKSADVVSGKECRVNYGGLNYSYPNKAAFVSRVQYHN